MASEAYISIIVIIFLLSFAYYLRVQEKKKEDSKEIAGKISEALDRNTTAVNDLAKSFATMNEQVSAFGTSINDLGITITKMGDDIVNEIKDRKIK